MAKQPRRINSLTNEDYTIAIDVYRKNRSVEDVARVLGINENAANTLINRGYKRKGWHAIRLLIEEEETISNLTQSEESVERATARKRYKQMVEYYEASNMMSLKVKDNKPDPSAKPLFSVKELRDLWQMRKELLQEEAQDSGYASPFSEWSDKDLLDFVTGKRRPRK